ncbi:uncharacterized protein PHACADRAFT_182029 [Phanerochaete carnosa HHB-10118-sp]|uniref:Uncharacterized protein n=1 Tax=Phanerochaete carnosa (strain HHB-10118-sp) TaxID=650164 RepID=K5W0Y3_PHACS|nr:uncharacterized protein PHACADRAFT_182029 [Phanerochaete carnosa HHB-10118-sp]EKM57493.1 hypothetical protein PHACADRAFT_182029 [Phanerochaete carnosa HHB-10118-sp]
MPYGVKLAGGDFITAHEKAKLKARTDEESNSPDSCCTKPRSACPQLTSRVQEYIQIEVQSTIIILLEPNNEATKGVSAHKGVRDRRTEYVHIQNDSIEMVTQQRRERMCVVSVSIVYQKIKKNMGIAAAAAHTILTGYGSTTNTAARAGSVEHVMSKLGEAGNYRVAKPAIGDQDVETKRAMHKDVTVLDRHG